MSDTDAFTLRPEDIMPFRQFAEAYPNLFPNKTSPDWMLRNKGTNGLLESGAIIKLQRQWYVVIPRFMQYVVSRAA